MNEKDKRSLPVQTFQGKDEKSLFKHILNVVSILVHGNK